MKNIKTITGHTIIPNKIFEAGLSNEAKLLYMTISALKQYQGVTEGTPDYMDLNKIEKVSELNRNAIRKYIDELVHKGLLSQDFDNYTFNFCFPGDEELIYNDMKIFEEKRKIAKQMSY